MQIRIGELKFGGDSPYKIEPGVSGLTTPDIRMGDGLYTGLDGGYVSSQLYGTRTITFTGFYVAKSCEDFDKLRKELLGSLRIRYLYPIYIKTFSGKNYYTEGYVADIKADIEGPRANEFQLSILCPDPVIYDGGDGTNADSAWLEQTFYKEGAGGFDMEYETPVQWVAGEQNTVVKNAGELEAYPIITLGGGVYTTPTITNLTTGKFIMIDRTIQAGYSLSIDMKRRTVVLTDPSGNVASVASDRTVDSFWWTLLPGLNRVVLTTEDADDAKFGVVKYRQGYQGI